MKDTAAVIVTYNRCELLRQNIECLLNQKNAECDIYVIDNASTDSTPEMVKSFTDERVHYFSTGANLGGAGGFEYGIKRAVEDGYSFVWVMDDDTLPSPAALFSLLDAGKSLSNWGALSSAVFWTDGSVCKANRQKKSLFSFVTDDELRQHKPLRVKMASFVSLLVKSEAVRKVGLPHGEYFIWTDDYEFTARISREYDIYVVPDSRVVHAMKENKKINIAAEIPERLGRYRYVYRNDVHCYRQHGVGGWMYLAAKFAYTIMNILINSKTERLSKIKTVILGYREGFSFKPAIHHVGNLAYGGHRRKLTAIRISVYASITNAPDECGVTAA
ncbi:MAG: glycosyltransferase family 2 protein [Synergistaceae bacterium]|nr:glycosyltransferase family 2 protein [Synergistaceae bacterium]